MVTHIQLPVLPVLCFPYSRDDEVDNQDPNLTAYSGSLLNPYSKVYLEANWIADSTPCSVARSVCRQPVQQAYETGEHDIGLLPKLYNEIG